MHETILTSSICGYSTLLIQFLLDAPGDTGNIFTVKDKMNRFRLDRHYFLPAATSTLAALFLRWGTTAYYYLLISIQMQSWIIAEFRIPAQSSLSKIFRYLKTLIWDGIEDFGPYFCDKRDKISSFFGHCHIFIEDFLQVLEIAPPESFSKTEILCFKYFFSLVIMPYSLIPNNYTVFGLSKWSYCRFTCPLVSRFLFHASAGIIPPINHVQ